MLCVCVCRWYHGNISGREAEILLQDKAQNGSYLVRASYHSPGDYVLSAKQVINMVVTND